MMIVPMSINPEEGDTRSQQDIQKEYNLTSREYVPEDKLAKPERIRKAREIVNRVILEDDLAVIALVIGELSLLLYVLHSDESRVIRRVAIELLRRLSMYGGQHF